MPETACAATATQAADATADAVVVVEDAHSSPADYVLDIEGYLVENIGRTRQPGMWTEKLGA